jgi:putative ABC transport system permease protein
VAKNTSSEQNILVHPEIAADYLVTPRWRKVLGDLWSNKTRTLLVVLSIFVGVFAVGMIAGAQAILSHELQQGYARIKPAHATISTGGSVGFNADYTIDTVSSNDEGFTEELVDVVRHMDEVAAAEGRRNFDAQVLVKDEWKSIKLVAIDDFDDMEVNKVRFERGAWPPPEKTFLLERSGLAALGKEIGDTVTIERPDGKQHTLTIAGIAHDLTEWPTPFLGMFYGYVTFDTMESLGEPRKYNEMLIRVAEHADDQQHNEAVAEEVYEKIQNSGRDPSFPSVPPPGEHPLNFLIVAIISVMGLLGIFAIFLSGFLVTNTIAALLAQQIKQIGIMKAVGARSTQIMSIYMVLVVCFGLLALLPAIPLAQMGARGFAGFMAAFLNFDTDGAEIPTYVLLLQVAISLAVPVIAALIPIHAGTHITVREALDSGAIANTYGDGAIDRFIQRVRGLPRPVLLSLRNTFRRKARVALTLLTLTIGGAFFISVFSIKDSLWQTIEEMMTSMYGHDIEVYLDRLYNTKQAINEAMRVPGVAYAESASLNRVRRIYPDDSESLDIQMFAVPPDTRTMDPIMLKGRWLLPEDENALVISNGLLHEDPDIAVGDAIVLKIKNRETTWHVVGLMKAMGEARWAYSNLDYYERVARDVGKTSYLRVVTENHSPAAQTQAAKDLEEHFEHSSVDISYTKTMHELSQGDREAVQVMTISLMIVAILVAIVGGLGLAGTMSLNVIERTREIGIMRSIGAADTTVLQIFMVEGLLIGMLSWAMGALLSLPIGQFLSYTLGTLLFSSSLSFRFSIDGILFWLFFSLLLAALASFLPAWRATKMTVRDVLAYE